MTQLALSVIFILASMVNLITLSWKKRMILVPFAVLVFLLIDIGTNHTVNSIFYNNFSFNNYNYFMSVFFRAIIIITIPLLLGLLLSFSKYLRPLGLSLAFYSHTIIIVGVTLLIVANFKNSYVGPIHFPADTYIVFNNLVSRKYTTYVAVLSSTFMCVSSLIRIVANYSSKSSSSP